jgi:hypothetical protein
MAEEKIEKQEIVEQVETKVENIDPSESVEAEKKVLEGLKKEKKEAKEDHSDGPSDGIISKIKSFVTGKTETKVEDKGEDIPESFTEAARKTGWSDEEIVEFASNYKDDELKEMVNYLSVEEKTEEKIEEKDEVKTEKKEEKKETKTDDKESEAIKALRAELDTLKSALTEVKETRKKGETQAMGQFAENFLDKASETFEVFGKGKDMPKFPDGRLIPSHPSYKARAEVLGYALKFHSTGSSWDTALKDALTLYKGKYLEKDIERSVIKRLKASEEKLSPNRYNKVTEKTYTDETEREADVVVQAARKAGSEKYD